PDQSNEPIALDTDNNGIGDGTVLGPAAQQFCAPLPSTGTAAVVTIEVFMDAGSEEIALDDVSIDEI
ncbi:MAG: hypothetical protein KC656_36940, partial [Myxococcales bacterium]|nr:hypothetical protein [Myxococcales bacterium]